LATCCGNKTLGKMRGFGLDHHPSKPRKLGYRV